MIRLFSINAHVIHELEFEPDTLKQSLASASWIDVVAPTDEETRHLESFLRDEVPDSDDYEEIEASARCFVDHNGIHVNSLFLVSTEGAYETCSVACILQSERLITIREERIADFRLFRMRAKRGFIDCISPTTLLISLLEQKVENLADILENLHHQLEVISKPILNEKIESPQSLVSELAMAEDSNGKTRLCLMDTQRDISFLQRHLREDNTLQDTCKEIAKDIDTLLAHTAFLFDKINFLMGFMQGYISIQQNQIIKTFSIAAVVFLPPTLVASIYGMNFDFMPELHTLLGYPFALVAMVLAGIAPYWYFKRKGWL
jgi:magnesium transporter